MLSRHASFLRTRITFLAREQFHQIKPPPPIPTLQDQFQEKSDSNYVQQQTPANSPEKLCKKTRIFKLTEKRRLQALQKRKQRRKEKMVQALRRLHTNPFSLFVRKHFARLHKKNLSTVSDPQEAFKKTVSVLRQKFSQVRTKTKFRLRQHANVIRSRASQFLFSEKKLNKGKGKKK